MSNNISFDLEQLKKEKDGLDVIKEFYIHAIFGEKIPEEDLFRLQWYGIYASDKEQSFFELKIPLSMGELTLNQLKVLTDISKNFANNSLTFSSEQKIELKNIKIFNLPKIFTALKEVNLTTFFESGHTVRRVATCPLNGIDNTQLFDVTKLVNELDDTFIGNKRYSNLPDKLQIALSGYEEGCALNYIPDISFNASKDEKEKIFFTIKLCGEYFGYVYSSQVVNTAKAIAKLFRDFGNREIKKDSSFKTFISSWKNDEFYNLVNSTLPFSIKNKFLDFDSKNMKKPRMGIHESLIEGESYIGCKLDNKEHKSENIEKLTTLLEKFDSTKIKITHKGNIIILGTPSKVANSLAKELEKINFNPFI